MSGTAGRSGRFPDILPIDDGEGAYTPERPDFTDDAAAEMWDRLVVELAGRLRPEFAPLLQSACELWGLYRAAYAAALVNPIDKNARTSLTNYWAKFEQATARFGMNPADRQRLKVKPTKQGVRRRQA